MSKQWFEIKPYELCSKYIDTFFNVKGDDYSKGVMALIGLVVMPFMAFVFIFESFTLPASLVAWIYRKIKGIPDAE